MNQPARRRSSMTRTESVGSAAAWILFAVLSAAALPAGAAAQDGVAYHEALDPALFPVPESQLAAVEFWRDIFARYSSTEVVLHDSRYLDVVYGVVDVTDLYTGGLSDVRASKQRNNRVKARTREVEELLRHLGGDRRVDADPQEAARVASLMANVPGDRSKYRSAIRRVRAQTGQRDRFAEAIEISGMFLADIERIMIEHGVPIEVSRLPFVESMFNYKARSKVGASGAWQFTRAAARQVKMRVDSAVDERSDVLLAAEGAARKLTTEYDRLQSWPLTLTAYNHGVAGMARAVRQVGSRDIGEIAKRYRSRTFGFASRNFYPEFVAAVTVYADREELFSSVTPRPRLRFDQFTPSRYVSLLDLALLTDVDRDLLVELNPALSREVARGRLLVPPGYPLRVPVGAQREFRTAYDEIPAGRKLNRQLATRYRVRRGDTLGAIARRNRTTVAALQRANNLPRPDRIYVGQILEIPNGGGGSLPPLRIEDVRRPAPQVATETGGRVPHAAPATHVVRPGETLSGIAGRYGTSVAAIARANRLRSVDVLRVGQRLEIPDGSVLRYQVRRGDTLSRIASAYGTTVRRIMDANRLRSTVIQVGQVLRVPLS